MDFAALRSAESGSVVLLEFSWPWPPDLEVEPQSLASILAGCWVTALMYRRPLMAALGPLFALGKREPCQEGSKLRPLPPAARQDLVLLAALAPAMTSNVSAVFSSVVPLADRRPKRMVHSSGRRAFGRRGSPGAGAFF